MKIALVTRRYPPLIGGAEKVLSYLAPALAAEEAEVTVLTSVTALKIAASSSPIPPIVRLPGSQIRFLGTFLYMRNLARWFTENRVDLAYVSMLKHDAYTVLGMGKRLKFPVVLRPEGAGATGDLAWQKWGRFGKQIGRRCKTADAVVSISPGVRGELEAAGYDPLRIHDLPNGVPIPDFPWKPRLQWQDAPQAAFVGRLAPEKGLDVLVAAWPRVLEKFPQAKLVLVGEGPERFSLTRQIGELGLSRVVELSGIQSDPTSLLRQSDLFILPSHEEGMSIALLEAMALGIPVVASDIPGNRGVMSDGQHGALFEAGNPEALASSILRQWANFGQAREQAESARRRVVENYSIAAVARRHLDLFDHLIRAQTG